jgi:hypothetical protein
LEWAELVAIETPLRLEAIACLERKKLKFAASHL